ncbi:MAG: peptide-methionine (S)-S-oxide reductase [Candidatus Dadabacteria bacterium RIFCSPHIGHO2_12_FULL_53_21]|nr:MAG: peptide-methionine (S)-S-oxide reductase [Candidatus Dadabacteria bacterium RIFCSPHIGHO2_12_FULL_53_21]
MNKFLFTLAALLVISLTGLLRAEESVSTAKTQDAGYETATFAGGCFWCIQPPFDKLEGVVSTTVGYTGGKEKDPTYEQVSYGKTGHAESIEIIYDPKKVTYEGLLEVFWMNIDPTDSGGQFVDRGKQYRPAIFYHGEGQKKAAEASKAKLDKSGRFDKPVVVEIVEATEFYPAEDYHQKFYQKSPVRYKTYRWGSGRDQFIEKYWGEAALSH